MERRLAAILAADVVGYTRLMGADETATLRRLTDLRSGIINPLIDEHHGRVVKLMGDGWLVEFASVVDAVACAVAWQVAVADDQADHLALDRFAFRIGVNVGDVMVEGDDIHGNGVNVAARLEAIADPGGIAISSDAYRQVHGNIDAPFEDIGKQSLKNVAHPVRVYRLVTDNSPAPRGAPLLDKPSIAVMPFDNLSGDADQAFFADGMTEDIITDLSRMPWFFVIARNTAFTYTGLSRDVKQVAAELGVRYVLEGSVRRSANRLRITAQLIDDASGQHVWAERYDREIVDIFDIQDEVTQAIVGAIEPQFLSVEDKRARRKDPAQLDAWECLMRGRAHIWKLSREDGAVARDLFQRAVRLDPNGEFGAGDLALVYFLEAYYGWSDDRPASLALLLQAATAAVASDDTDPWALTLLSWAHIVTHSFDDVLPPIQRAIDLSPSFAPAIGVRGSVLALLGRPEDAIADIAHAKRLSPRDGMLAFWQMGLFWAYHSLARYPEAEATAREAIRSAPDNPTFRRQLAAALSLQGRPDEAAEAIRAYRRLEPNHTTADAAMVPSSDPETIDRFVAGLRAAGLPDP